jgi:pimeloyl-ACP methyl ester carboxylesterase
MLCGLLALGATQLPAAGAGALIHPFRRRVNLAPPPSCVDVSFAGAGASLRGWHCLAAGVRRGTLVYLHGIADNRTSAAGLIDRFTRIGFDVVAYDSRAHGESEGTVCTYGFFEKEDLRRVLDAMEPGPFVLVGTSLGAAVALQAAELDGRVSAVVAAESFSDLRTVATERAPFFFNADAIARAFTLAERQAGFSVDAVSPAAAAARITAPVLLIHGERDVDTPADHSRRVFAALAGPKRLLIVPNAGHNGALTPDVWDTVEEWIGSVVRGIGIPRSRSKPTEGSCGLDPGPDVSPSHECFFERSAGEQTRHV